MPATLTPRSDPRFEGFLRTFFSYFVNLEIFPFCLKTATEVARFLKLFSPLSPLRTERIRVDLVPVDFMTDWLLCWLKTLF